MKYSLLYCSCSMHLRYGNHYFIITNFKNAVPSQIAVLSKSFQAILGAIREHAAANDIPEELAAEEIVQTFRDIDRVWDDYIFQEGLNKLKGHLST